MSFDIEIQHSKGQNHALGGHHTHRNLISSFLNGWMAKRGKKNVVREAEKQKNTMIL